MSKYTKTDITKVDAFKWTGSPEQIEDPEWIVELIKSGRVTFENQGTSDIKMIIENGKKENQQIALPGNYIVKYEITDFILAWESDIFESCFELVKEEGESSNE